MAPTPQQQRVIDHDHTTDGRVVAGPGTGKSWTAIELLRRLRADVPDLKVALLTFTRAATGELVKKTGEQGLEWLEPSTVHAFALRLLLQNARQAAVNLPLRLPDSWETETLIQPDMARRLRDAGFRIDARGVNRLEREMAAQWESLDVNLVLLADLDPALRNAYIGQWSVHRQRFGYMLLAEITYRAGNLIEDFDPDLGGLAFLLVDEYQDLNRADIRFLTGLRAKGVRILGIGDDDQSIYGFRMAAPEGIVHFPASFPGAANYPLTISMRCGRRIIDAATTLIETAPHRLRRPRLVTNDGCPDGVFAYLRFPGHVAEARGVADLVAQRLRRGVEAKDIAVLVRSSVGTWASLLRPELEARAISVVDTDWVDRALADRTLRTALAVARLALERTDSLAWWTLLHLTDGIAPSFVSYIDQAAEANETLGQCLLRLAPAFAGAPTARTARAAARLIEEQLAAVAALDTHGLPDDAAGWGAWLSRRVVAANLSAEAAALLDSVGRAVPVEGGLANFLGQLEPVGKDLATRADAVRIMTMTASKGLTVDSVFVMGVEAGITPLPAANLDEERRLVYVAMTRATEYCVLTWAGRRTGPTARRGAPNVNRPRGRCPLFDGLPIGQWQDGDQFVRAGAA